LLITLAAFGLLSQPSQAADAESAATEASQEQAKQKSSNKRVCKKVRTTGSRIPQKVCMRQRQWDEVTERSQRTANEMRDSAELNPGG
jgi:hypothetical protein